MRRVFFLTLGALLPFLASAEGGWKVAGQSGQQQWVLIDNKREKDTDLYQTSIDKLCAGKSFCYVLFWSDQKDDSDVLADVRRPVQGDARELDLQREDGLPAAHLVVPDRQRSNSVLLA